MLNPTKILPPHKRKDSAKIQTKIRLTKKSAENFKLSAKRKPFHCLVMKRWNSGLWLFYCNYFFFDEILMVFVPEVALAAFFVVVVVVVEPV